MTYVARRTVALARIRSPERCLAADPGGLTLGDPSQSTSSSSWDEVISNRQPVAVDWTSWTEPSAES